MDLPSEAGCAITSKPKLDFCCPKPLPFTSLGHFQFWLAVIFTQSWLVNTEPHLPTSRRCRACCRCWPQPNWQLWALQQESGDRLFEIQSLLVNFGTSRPRFEDLILKFHCWPWKAPVCQNVGSTATLKVFDCLYSLFKSNLCWNNHHKKCWDKPWASICSSQWIDVRGTGVRFKIFSLRANFQSDQRHFWLEISQKASDLGQIYFLNSCLVNVHIIHFIQRNHTSFTTYPQIWLIFFVYGAFTTWAIAKRSKSVASAVPPPRWRRRGRPVFQRLVLAPAAGGVDPNGVPGGAAKTFGIVLQWQAIDLRKTSNVL